MEVNATLIDCCDPQRPSRVLFHFLILDAPSPSNLPTYIKELQHRGVRHLVRVCGPTYDATLVKSRGIEVHSWPFDDGAPPTRAVLDSWLKLLDTELARQQEDPSVPPPTIGVHCVAGLGRAPILVALALVEYGNVSALDAIALIREKRRGAINQTQMHWITKYKRRHQSGGCVIM
ncbi:protein tyrosine phosphatase-like protein [Leishmania infantum JPCM5]|uniref:Protein tyrosine phosphatase PRL-1 n=2 Tax=Leishmania infantum TaxID=5671 RepID=A0A6L0X2L0_LEIIN|nr:protein tyrosine phosphatase-like protein [Leishmania infantum JPCM5]CAC9474294.1 protein_tyrosine_phosphatase-like_protein [Leishmania infantum]CAM66902.1 protein tyrosine phosphatase-like protein [Leishmania infantum JPCM5]SUZ40601.1 protein_tyrosine_phosphatase-like_protein [Leishmania infantum]|eukprot:XP_001464513.1 protein tyrosine phosphatase-like protein [Leishmania infantum JPCM5]